MVYLTAADVSKPGTHTSLARGCAAPLNHPLPTPGTKTFLFPLHLSLTNLPTTLRHSHSFFGWRVNTYTRSFAVHITGLSRTLHSRIDPPVCQLSHHPLHYYYNRRCVSRSSLLRLQLLPQLSRLLRRERWDGLLERRWEAENARRRQTTLPTSRLSRITLARPLFVVTLPRTAIWRRPPSRPPSQQASRSFWVSGTLQPSPNLNYHDQVY